ncbi:hypothetical protein NKW84_10080 [Acetobacter senegalensis]|uniref:hypothetical protein n=1 Tax=Acetobacter senegalensis TaxID=446692 RepID=UPI0020A22586|nr:hypothetical protein [Acetobacter senegalensis]MCP1196206.1 hypothetical protein [Acetobacter senegalensis]
MSTLHGGDIREDIQSAIATCLHDLATAKDAELVKMHKARAESLKTLAQALEIATGSSAEATRKKGVKEERREAAEQLVSSGRFAPQPPPRVVWDNDKPKNRTADG